MQLVKEWLSLSWIIKRLVVMLVYVWPEMLKSFKKSYVRTSTWRLGPNNAFFRVV